MTDIVLLFSLSHYNIIVKPTNFFSVSGSFLISLLPPSLPPLPSSLPLQHTRVHLLDTESFKATFGQHSLRKRPKLFSADLQVCRFFLQDNLKTLQDHAFKGRMQYIVMAIRNITKDRVLETLLKIGC